MEKTNGTSQLSNNRDTGTTKSCIIVIDTFGNVREYPLDRYQKERLTIGRNSDNDFIIASPLVSAHHGKFKISGSRFLYADLNSTNGTIFDANGRQKLLQGNKEYCELKPGDMLRIQPKNPLPDNAILILYSGNGEQGAWSRYPLLASQTTIGRDSTNDIVLPKQSISRRHARIEKSGNGFVLSDLNSSNGVYLNNCLIDHSVLLHEKDVIQIAGEILIYSANCIFVKNSIQGIAIEVSNVNKLVDRGKKKLLDDVNCVIESNEFVAIVGGSGAGKTTAMNAISGFDKRITGKVYFNGIDVHANFNSLKSLIGYVPQEDIIYDNLKLKKMLEYTAKLKMPKDTTKAERKERIQAVLDMVELTEHQDTFIRKLSGGQKKRASIAVELLADPKVFFLDEPTSGLDPGTEQKLMILLNKLAKSQGKTIIMVTHATQSLALCDKVLFMGRGGQLCFAGHVSQAKMYFDTNDLVEIYNLTSEQPDAWSEQYRQLIAEDRSERMSLEKIQKPNRKLDPKQLLVLSARYSALICNDLQRLAILFLQPILIALLLKVVANREMFRTKIDTQSILFALCCAAIWIGLFNSIQEICKERAILKREYMGGVHLFWYALSKFLVQTVVGLIQAALMVAVFTSLIGSPAEGILLPSAVLEFVITIWLTIEASMALGFVISSLVKTVTLAMTFAPIALIIQLLFSGFLFSLTGLSEKISYITISKWSMEAMGSSSVLNDMPTKLQQTIMSSPIETSAEYISTASHILFVWGILWIMTAVCLFLCTLLLRNLSGDGR